MGERKGRSSPTGLNQGRMCRASGAFAELAPDSSRFLHLRARCAKWFCLGAVVALVNHRQGIVPYCLTPWQSTESEVVSQRPLWHPRGKCENGGGEGEQFSAGFRPRRHQCATCCMLRVWGVRVFPTGCQVGVHGGEDATCLLTMWWLYTWPHQ